jgi:hypothetical protein
MNVAGVCGPPPFSPWHSSMSRISLERYAAAIRQGAVLLASVLVQLTPVVSPDSQSSGKAHR